MDAYNALGTLSPGSTATIELPDYVSACYNALSDDLNSPKVIAELFDATHRINTAKNGDEALTAEQIVTLKELFETFLFEILGILLRLEGLQCTHRSICRSDATPPRHQTESQGAKGLDNIRSDP